MARQREFTFGTVPHQDLTKVGMYSHYGAAAAVVGMGAQSRGKTNLADKSFRSQAALGMDRIKAENTMKRHVTNRQKAVGNDSTRRYAFQYGMSLN